MRKKVWLYRVEQKKRLADAFGFAFEEIFREKGSERIVIKGEDTGAY